VHVLLLLIARCPCAQRQRSINGKACSIKQQGSNSSNTAMQITSATTATTQYQAAARQQRGNTVKQQLQHQAAATATVGKSASTAKQHQAPAHHSAATAD
jgi:hypothetical protein